MRVGGVVKLKENERENMINGGTRVHGDKDFFWNYYSYPYRKRCLLWIACNLFEYRKKRVPPIAAPAQGFTPTFTILSGGPCKKLILPRQSLTEVAL